MLWDGCVLPRDPNVAGGWIYGVELGVPDPTGAFTGTGEDVVCWGAGWVFPGLVTEVLVAAAAIF